MEFFMDSPNTVMCDEVVRSQYWLLTGREVVVMGICVSNLKGGMNIHTSGMGVLTPYPNSSKIHLSFLGVVDHHGYHGILSFEIPKIQSQSFGGQSPHFCR
jgi:hypothetical protein